MRFLFIYVQRRSQNKHLRFLIHVSHAIVHPPLVSKSYASRFCHVRTSPVSLVCFYNLYATPFLSFPSQLLWWNWLKSKEIREKERQKKQRENTVFFHFLWTKRTPAKKIKKIKKKSPVQGSHLRCAGGLREWWRGGCRREWWGCRGIVGERGVAGCRDCRGGWRWRGSRASSRVVTGWWGHGEVQQELGPSRHH